MIKLKQLFEAKILKADFGGSIPPFLILQTKNPHNYTQAGLL
jgi:hypothetical protein